MRMFGVGMRRGWLAIPVLFAVLLTTVSGAFAEEEAVENLRKQGKLFAKIVKETSPAVVAIAVEGEVEVSGGGGGLPPGFTPPPGLPEEFFDRFFGQPRQRRDGGTRIVRGAGSGFIISPEGYILTNHHVVGEADRIEVKLLDGRTFEAERVGSDPLTDVAVIRIDATDLPVIALGNSEAVEVGEWVLAIGNPFELAHTVTAGIVSAKGRSGVGIIRQGHTSGYEDFIQTDAAINPGNSGGPLVNLAGEAIGINTAIASRSGGNIGIGFAIPMNMARDIYQRLRETGHVTRGFIGILLRPLSSELATEFGVENAEGVLVERVMEETPAEAAGLQRGDVIVGLNGRPITDADLFRYEVASMAPGTEIDLTIIRRGEEKSLSLTLGTLPDAESESGRPVMSEGSGRYGITIETLTPETAAKLGYDDNRGVLIRSVEQGSPASREGLRKGMRILEAEHAEVNSVDEFRNVLRKMEEGKNLLLYVEPPSGMGGYVVVRPK